MNWESLPLLFLFFTAGALLAFFTAVFFKNRATMVGAAPLSLALAGLAVSALASGARIAIPDPSVHLLWIVAQVLVMAIVPVAVLVFSLQYAGKVRRPVSLSAWALLLLLPAGAAAILFITMDLSGITATLPWTPDSPAFWILAWYNEILILAAILFLVQCYRAPSGIYLGQLACLLVAILTPSFLHVAFLFRITPFSMIDLAPVGGIVTTVALAAGIRRFCLFDIVPVNHAEAFRQVPSGILITDAGGRVIETNPAALLMLGIGEREITGRPVAAVFPQLGGLLPGPKAPVAGRHGVIRRETGGVTRDIEVRIVPVISSPGIPQNRLILLSDVTDQKLIEHALNKARRNINLLTAITRHDILNQLTVIILHNEILLAEVTDEKLLKSVVEQEKAARNISRQIAFTKEYEQLGENLPAWTDIRKVLLKQIESLGYEYIHYSIHVEGLEVFCDPLIDRVFYNFLDNSFRYGQKVTSVRVYTVPHAEGLSLVYEDNGIGIAEKDKERVFQRLYGRRAGFGLFFTRELLSLTGITIRETGREGSGVRFEMLVPHGKFRFPHDGTAEDAGDKA